MDAAGATPIFLLPGMDGTGHLLDGLADRLSARRPVRLLSYPLDQPLGYADLVSHVLERLPDGPFVILGESFSGPVAIEIAARQQPTVGLILASSFARHPLPAWLAPLAGFIDLKWVPKGIIAAA